MSGQACPTCGAVVEAPKDEPESLEGSVECPACGRPLTWYFDDRTGGRWIIDEGAEGRRRLAEGPGDVDSPAAA
jgi:endogenous inhibitor of DNA gyrase (YacG/DUF329 family)